ncbi:hypothetical protein OA57_02960 [Chelonobacter oris]|uniref:VOC family protein n=1 Tax=Chelonobacter oris TaxID=505317 RepID=A0A0A3ATZ7_9PAST|nr:VOC family protein [Chelonobacter oris]KGQ71202.1 hypothetical protein OA57_02960 [Chelonobacter oris]
MTNLTQAHPLFADQTALQLQFSGFERQILQLAQVIGFTLADLMIDHAAIRVNSAAQGRIWLEALLKCGRILSDNIVNGRPIYLLLLDQPLLLAGQAVSIVELPMPKKKHYPQEGWEHIEIVFPFLAKESPNEWLERVIRQFSLNKNRLLEVKVDEPKVKGERLCNISVAIRLINNTQNNACIKLHPHHIIDVVQSERQ